MSMNENSERNSNNLLQLEKQYAVLYLAHC